MTNYIAFETTNDLRLAHPLSGAAMHVLPCSEVMTKPDQNNSIESGIGLPVATPVQPVPVGLSRGGRNWIHAAQRGEGRLGVDALRVTAGRNQQCSRSVGSYSEDADESGGCPPGQLFQLGLKNADLPIELKVAAGKGPKGVLGRRCGILQATRTEALAARCEGVTSDRQCLSQYAGAVTTRAFIWLTAWVRAFTAESLVLRDAIL